MNRGQVYSLCGSCGGKTNYYAMIRNSLALFIFWGDSAEPSSRTIVLVAKSQPQTARSLSRTISIIVCKGRDKEEEK